MQGRLAATHKISDALVTLPLSGFSDGHYVLRVMQAGELRMLRLEVIGGE
jgi:hypothetical protein